MITYVRSHKNRAIIVLNLISGGACSQSYHANPVASSLAANGSLGHVFQASLTWELV